MKSYSKYLADANVPSYSSRPAPKYVWHAYKEGNLVYTSEVSQSDAELHGASKVVEKVLENKDEISAWEENYKDRMQLADSLWIADLREEYSGLNEEIFNMCYDQAWERGHSCGHDEVAGYMSDIVYFVQKVLAAYMK